MDWTGSIDGQIPNRGVGHAQLKLSSRYPAILLATRDVSDREYLPFDLIVEKVILGIRTLSIELRPPMLFTDNEVTGSITK